MKIRLTTKLILSIVAVEAIMLFILVWNSTRLINNSHTELFHNAIKTNSELLANAIVPGLAAYDRALLNDTLSLLEENNDLTYASIYDYNNDYIAGIKSGKSLDEKYHGKDKIGDKDKDTIHITKNIYIEDQYLGKLHVNYSLHTVNQQISRTRNQNVAIAIIALILSVIATLLIAYYLNHRIHKLEVGTHEFSRGKVLRI